MANEYDIHLVAKENTKKIGNFISKFDVDIFGITNLNEFKDKSNIISNFHSQVLKNFNFAIVLGYASMKTGKKFNGTDISLFLEDVALRLTLHLIEKEKHSALIIHTEDEMDPVNCYGLLSLKALAKAAGLGWQGRSLLIISPKFGPLYRLIAILTDLPLIADIPILNQCGECQACIEKCPTGALKMSDFIDHPEKREDVLNILKCNGDEGCKICINVCPWIKGNKVFNVSN
jgi:epoxyqueuosine reductase